MINADEFVNTYWNYYRHLERKFLATRNYVTFTEQNFKTFSDEFVSLLQVICSELDVVMKEACGYPGNKNKNMNSYKVDAVKKYPNLSSAIVHVKFFDMDIQPFEHIAGSMDWWAKYNSVKHRRATSIIDANLKNVLYAFAGVFVLERLMLRDLDEDGYHIVDYSELFQMKDWEDEGRFVLISKKTALHLMQYS